MPLSHKVKRRWSLVILLVALPIWIIAATSVMTMFDQLPILVELLVYLVLGVIWALPFRNVFRGVGQADPDHPDD